MDGSMEKTPGKGRITVRKVISLILIALVVYCCVYSLIVRAAKNDSLPMPLGFGVGVVLTGSMEPTCSVNDLIVAVKAKDYKAGDIVVYQTGGTPVVHRIIEVSDNGVITTKGDANNAADEPITLSKVKGRVLFSIPYIGAVMTFIKSVPGMIMILIVLFLLLALSVRSREQEQNEDNKRAQLEKELSELRERLGDAARQPSDPENGKDD